MEELKKKRLSKAFMEEHREAILEIYRKPHRKCDRPRVLTKKEKKVLGIGKDEGRASVYNVRMAPIKVNLLVKNIKGKDYAQAKAILDYSPRAAAVVLAKLLRSAQANAEVKELDVEKLYVAEAYVNPGPVLRRFMPKARGSATRILKRSSHITLVLKERK